MAGESVQRDVILELLLVSAAGNKAEADKVRALVESLAEDMAAGYALAREAAVKEAKATADGQIAAARSAATQVAKAYASATGSGSATTMRTAVARPPGGIVGTGTVTATGGGGNNRATGGGGGRSDADRAAAEAEKAFDREAAAAVKAYSRIMKERDKAAGDAEKLANKQRQAAEKAFEAEASAAVKAYAKIMRERERLSAVIVNATDQAQQAGNQATKSAAEGAAAVVKIGRGFAEVGLLSEKSTEAMLRGLIKVQAGFDILTGGIDLYVKLSEAIRAATKATQAQAAAQAAVNALNATGGAASAGKAAAGGIAGAAGAAAVGAGGTAAATGTLGTATAGLVAFLAPLAGIAIVATAAIAGLQELVILLGKFAGLNLEWSGSLTGLWKESTKSAASTKKLEDNEKKLANAREMIATKNQRAVEADSLSRGVAALQQVLDSAERATGGGISERKGIVSDIAAAGGAVDAAAAGRRADKAAGRGDASAGEDLARQRLVEETQRLLQLDQQRVGVLNDQKSAQEQGLQAAKAAFEQSQKQVKSEQESFQDKLAQFGQLTAAEQNRVKGIADKIGRGEEISRADAKILQATGQAGQHVKKFFADEAAATGGVDALQKLGDRDALAKAEQDAAAAALDVTAAEHSLQATTLQLNAAMDTLRETMIALATRANEMLKLQQETQGRTNEASPTVRVPGGVSGAGDSPTKSQIDEINKAGEAAREANAELVAAMVGAMSDIQQDAINAAGEINRRRTAGALNQQAVG